MYDLPKCTKIYEDGIKKYQTDTSEKYPSITSLLSKTKDTSALEQWRQDMGEQVAEYILKQAGKIGTATHQIIENYLKKSTEYDISQNPLLARAHFDNLKPFLGKITDVVGLEIPLYSDILRTAGTADCIAKYDGKLSIIDFKTPQMYKLVCMISPNVRKYMKMA